MKLYEINEEILKCVDEETGEILDMDRLASLQLAFDEKVEGIACWIKELVAEAKAVKEEKDKLANRQKSLENRAESLKFYLGTYLNGQKFKSPKVTISYGKTVSVEVEDWKQLPEEFLKTKDPEPDKTSIKDALKNGVEIPGCALVENKHLRIG